MKNKTIWYIKQLLPVDTIVMVMVFLLNKTIWYIKQLLPLQYITTFTDITDETKPQRKLAIWRMWFGHQFWVREWNLSNEIA